GVGRNHVVHDGHLLARPEHPPTARGQAAEGLRARVLVHDVQVHVQQHVIGIDAGDLVTGHQFVVEGHAGHGSASFRTAMEKRRGAPRTDQFGSMPAALMMPAQRVISSATILSVCAGVEMSGSKPSRFMRSATSGERSASASFALSTSTTCCGVPAGAVMTNQVLNS